MESREEKLNSEFSEKIFSIFKDFMARVTEFEELVPVGSRFLTGFHQGLEFLRQDPIDKTSELVKNVINANKTKRLRSYLVAGCIKTLDSMQNISKLSTWHVGLHDHLTKDIDWTAPSSLCFQEEVSLSGLEKHEDTDFALLMGVIYSMLKQDYEMQERIVLSLNPNSSSGDLESYRLMWSLRPFLNDDIMNQAWKLIS